MSERKQQGPRVQIEITRVPIRPGRLRVRWLDEADGTRTHWEAGKPRGRSVPCPGDGCKHCGGGKPTDWRAYAPAEVAQSGGRWVPTVVEITGRLWWLLEGVTLRGTVWDLFRRPHRRDKEEVHGEQISEVDPRTLPPTFDFRSCVQRVYLGLPLRWGTQPVLGRPLEVACSYDPGAQLPEVAAEVEEKTLTPRELAEAYRRAGDGARAEKVEAAARREGTW